MNEIGDLPVHVQNTLRRAGIESADQARALGRDGLARIGVGPLALSRLFASQAAPEPRSHALSSDELRRVRRWFEVLEEAAPLRLGDGDQALARKIGGWID